MKLPTPKSVKTKISIQKPKNLLTIYFPDSLLFLSTKISSIPKTSFNSTLFQNSLINHATA